MGYAGYTPAKLPPAQPTPVEAAVQAVKNPESLEVMGKLLYNAAIAPRDEKFRRIKLSNKKIAEVIVNTPNALDALLALGWMQDEASPGELVMPKGLFFSMKEVRIVEAAKEKLAKSASSSKLSAMVAVQA